MALLATELRSLLFRGGRHLTPDKLVILVVGNQKEIDLGDDKVRAKLAELAAGGHVVTLPLRDPLTMTRKSN